MHTTKNPTKFTTLFAALLCLTLIVSCGKDSSTTKHTTWTHYAGSPDQSKYFDGSEITKENVNQLEVAWYYEADGGRNNFSPIVVDTIMYVTGKNNSLIAINIKNGEEIWIHANLSGLTRKGINYWESEDKKDKRLVFTLNNSIQEIDALTGKSITTFGDNGYVDLRVGVDREPSSIRRIQAMMPGVIVGDKLVIGSAPGENYFSAPGHVRAYNVVTGKLEWTFHTIPHPGEYGYETWPKDAYKYVGGANVWSEMSADVERGIVYLPIGSPTFDYYGGDRIGDGLFGNSLVAVDVNTGKRLWHFQTVHHDLWDYDLSPAPQLLTIKKDGKEIDIVAAATKHGYVFVFDRVTGEPIFPIEEKPFPASDVPGEQTSPTQPIPTLPSFMRHEVTKETINPYYSDSLKQMWYAKLDAGKTGLFQPPSDKYETIILPGPLGGANYGNTGSNPDKGLMFVMSQEHPSVYQLSKVAPPKIDLSADDHKKAQTLYENNCKTCHGPNLEGGVGPALKNVYQHIFYDEFKTIVLNGRGQMPGFVHVDETSLANLYRFMGGNPRSFNFRRGNQEESMPEGPVVASGGIKIPDDEQRVAPLSDYPDDVEHPEDRYTTGYGLEWESLMSPPWSYIVAYDMNKGEIKWKKPIGEDFEFVNGDKTKGAVIGVQRKSMVVTSTGIVFVTAKGGKLYALDQDTGNVLWETTLSNESVAVPAMYSIHGKQYLVINATGNFSRDSFDHSKEPGALPKGYVVYALPDKK
ncbi:MAG: PQQ-binding-like beta-propeller repeat protein [Flavobacteriales bacterium]